MSESALTVRSQAEIGEGKALLYERAHRSDARAVQAGLGGLAVQQLRSQRGAGNGLGRLSRRAGLDGEIDAELRAGLRIDHVHPPAHGLRKLAHEGEADARSHGLSGEGVAGTVE